MPCIKTTSKATHIIRAKLHQRWTHTNMTKMISTRRIKSLLRGLNRSSRWDSMTPIIPCCPTLCPSIIHPIWTRVRRARMASAVSWMTPSKTTKMSFTQNTETSEGARVAPALELTRIIGGACKPGREAVAKTSASSPGSTIAQKPTVAKTAFRVLKCTSNIRGGRRKRIRGEAGSPCRTKIRPSWTMAAVRTPKRTVIFSEHRI